MSPAHSWSSRAGGGAPQGDYTIAWSSRDQDASGGGVYAQMPNGIARAASDWAMNGG
ncbi:MAG: hypothetical protein U0836_08435 [Pirellulales bacterium]